MNIHLSRAENSSDRVSLVEVTICSPAVIASRIGFEVPTVANWLFRATKNKEFYMAPLPDSESPIRGVIVSGKWECFIQSNGCSEEENPISREDIKNILTQVITCAVLPFRA